MDAVLLNNNNNKAFDPKLRTAEIFSVKGVKRYKKVTIDLDVLVHTPSHLVAVEHQFIVCNCQ